MRNHPKFFNCLLKTTVFCLGLLVQDFAFPGSLNKEAQTLFDKAYKLANKENFLEAELLYEKALSLEPESQDIWMEYTVCLRKEKKLQSAMMAGLKALSLGPELDGLWGNLGNVFLDAGEWELAREAFKRANNSSEDIQYKTNNLLNLGYYAWINGSRDVAGLAYEEALKLNPESGKAMLDYGAYLLSIGKTEEGLDYIENSAEFLEKAKNEQALLYAQTLLKSFADFEKLDMLQQSQCISEKLLNPTLDFSQAKNAASPIDKGIAEKFIRVSDNIFVYIRVPSDWSATVNASEEDNAIPAFVFLDNSHTFECLLSFAKKNRKLEEIKASLQELGEVPARDSVEGKVILEEVKGIGGAGFLYRLTDKSLVGKKTNKENFLFMTQGIFKLQTVEVFFTILSNDASAESVDSQLKLIKQIQEITREMFDKRIVPEKEI